MLSVFQSLALRIEGAAQRWGVHVLSEHVLADRQCSSVARHPGS
jgi:hypothetical protein